MKKCILLHINDGKAELLHNGNFMLVERYVRAETLIEKYLAQGYEVKQIIPSYQPATQGEGNYTFYQSGITVYLEKDAADHAQTDERADPHFFDFLADADSEDADENKHDIGTEDIDVEEVIEMYLEQDSDFSDLDLRIVLEDMEYSRRTVAAILDAADCYDIWELYNVLFTHYRDLLTDEEYAKLAEKYKHTFDFPMPGDD